jgi:hypothetical protein
MVGGALGKSAMTRTGLCLAALGMLIASAASMQGPAPAAFRVISPIVPGEAAPYPSCAVKG